MEIYYESRRIYIKTVTFGLKSRNNIKTIFAIVALFGAIYSTELSLNKVDDSSYVECVQGDGLLEIMDSEVKEEVENLKNGEVPEEKVESKEENRKSKEENKIKESPKILTRINYKEQLDMIKRVSYKIQNEGKKTILTGEATAYTAESGARMANGQKPIAGIHCAMHRKYMGKTVEVNDGRNKYILKVGDTGGALNKGRALVDIYMNTREECMNFGRRNVTLKIL